jgi:hypothetical protein
MPQTIHAYVVSIAWSSGMMSLVPVVTGGGEETASALGMMASMRQEPIPQGDMLGVMVREVAVEWLRAAVRMIETGSIEPPPVLRLVESTHGSQALDEDARKLAELGLDPGPTLGDLDDVAKQRPLTPYEKALLSGGLPPLPPELFSGEPPPLPPEPDQAS